MDGMDMDGMDMSHEGMTGIGSDVNHAFARDYWYITAAVVAALMVVRGINHIGALHRLKASRDPSVSQPTRPDGPLSQAWATATAIARETCHPQLHLSLPGLAWASPPPLGRVLALLAYWAVVVYFMAWRVSIHDADYWERIGYRNAWVTLTQLPMLYLLSTKVNPLGLLVGTSHERLNWLHRWVARTMFVTATCHGFHFWTEWRRAGFVSLELAMMPMVKYGLGAWAVLLWSVVVGFLPLRRLWYEAWLLQHVASAIVLLVLLYIHIPTNGRYLFWLVVSFLLFDRAARWALLLWHNLHFGSSSSSSSSSPSWKGLAPPSSCCEAKRRIGHKILLRAVGDSTTVAVIKDVPFRWSPGQHLYLWIPRLGPLEAHPYTIACAHRIAGTCCCNSIQLIVRKHAGFSRRLHDHAVRRPDTPLTGFLSGPYGVPPRWDIYETMVLIGASTGASFTVPILESAAHADSRACLRRMDVVLIARTRAEIEYYLERSRDAGRRLREKGVDVRLHVAITGSQGSDGTENTSSGGGGGRTSNGGGSSQATTLAGLFDRDSLERNTIEKPSLDTSRPQSSGAVQDTAETDSRAPLADQSCCCVNPSADTEDEAPDNINTSTINNSNNSSNINIEKQKEELRNEEKPGNSLRPPESITHYASRPDIASLIRDPVEHAWGETAVVVCGGPGVVARTRNCVAALSDERAVHKGTGAQGIYLHVEEYSF